MPTKTPGGVGASDKELKKQAQAHGAGAPNAPGHTDIGKPAEHAPVASDSGSVKTGTEAATNQPGEKGISGVPVDSAPSQANANMK